MFRLLKRAAEGPPEGPAPLLATPYSTKSLRRDSPNRYVVELNPGSTAPVEVEIDNGWTRASYAGTGFMLIPRSALAAFRERFPEDAYISDVGDSAGETHWDYFKSGVARVGDRVRYLSEDYMFCERYRGIGGAIEVDVLTELTHFGGFYYSGRVVDSW